MKHGMIQSSAVDPINIRAYYEDVMDKYKEKEKKGKNKHADRFKDLLKSVPEITSATASLQVILPLIQNAPAFVALDSNEEREKIFAEYISKLKRKDERKKRKREEEVEQFNGKSHIPPPPPPLLPYERSPKRAKHNHHQAVDELEALRRRKQEILEQLKNQKWCYFLEGDNHLSREAVFCFFAAGSSEAGAEVRLRFLGLGGGADVDAVAGLSSFLGAGAAAAFLGAGAAFSVVAVSNLVRFRCGANVTCVFFGVKLSFHCCASFEGLPYALAFS